MSLYSALEPRRLFIAVAPLDVVSIAHGGAATGDEPTGYDYHHRPNTPPAAVSDDGRFVAFASAAHDLDPDEEFSESIFYYLRDRAAGTTRRLGTAFNHVQESVEPPSISGDGRRVAFTPLFLDNVPPDLNELFDVYVYDTQTGTTTLASAKPDGTPGGGELATISRNGRYVAFTSAASLDGASANGGLFRRDLQTGVTQRVDSAERPFHFGDYREPVKPDISDDGNVIAYRTPEGGQFVGVNIAVRDMAAGTIELASVGPDGAEAPDYSEDSPGQFDLAGDGRHVAFVTSADAVPQDVNFVRDVYVRDLLANTTVLASAAADGTTHEGIYEYGATTPTISNDGRFVAFESDFVLTSLPDIDPTDAPYSDVYLRDLQTGVTRVASTNLAGTTAIGGLWPMLSADGHRLAFSAFWIAQTTGTPVPADGSESSQVLVMDTLTGERTLAGVLRPDGWAYALHAGIDEAPVLSRNGNVVVFTAEGALHQEGGGPGAFPGIVDSNAGPDLLAATVGPAAGADVQPPTPSVVPPLAVPSSGATFYDFTVTWQDNVAMDLASVGNGDVFVTGPAGYNRPATLLSATPVSATQVNAVYRVVAPGGVFDAAATGTYAIEVVANEVKDAGGNAAPAGAIAGAAFTINIVAPDAPDLAAASLQGALPASVVAGAKQKVKPLQLTVTNSGTQPAQGTVTVRLLASADGIADANDAVVIEVPNQKVKLAPGKSKVFRIKPGLFPNVSDGDYQLLAVIDAGGAMAERLESNNAAPAAGVVRIAAPFSDIGITAPSLSGKLAPGKKATLLVTARNEGNTAAKGVQSARVHLTTDPANSSAVSRVLDVPLKVNLKPGATKALRAKLALPADLPAGTYYLVIELLPGAPWNDPDAADNIATGAATYTV